jgi:hypothetical protein
VNWIGCGRKKPWPNLLIGGYEESHRNLVRISAFQLKFENKAS